MAEEPPRRARLQVRATAERVRRLRLEKGWTQEELASRARIGRSTVSRIERAEERPAGRTAAALATALGVQVGALLGPVPGQPTLFPGPDEWRIALLRRLLELRDDEVEAVVPQLLSLLDELLELRVKPRRARGTSDEKSPP